LSGCAIDAPSATYGVPVSLDLPLICRATWTRSSPHHRWASGQTLVATCAYMQPRYVYSTRAT
jgi:hypothetical protein